MRILLYSTLVFLMALPGCKTFQSTSAKVAQDGKYTEDLSGLRPQPDDMGSEDSIRQASVKRDPKTYVEPRYTVNKQLDAVLDSIDRINLNRRFIDGYSIQVYSGLSREEALNAKRDLTLHLPKIEADIQYNQPNFRVKAGKYINQLEAQKDFQAIKKYFPNAIIVPDKIAMN